MTAKKVYGLLALDYFTRGWSPIPIVAADKVPAVRGFSGWRGRFPDRAQVTAWCEQFPGHNLGLRLPPDVVGIDVDVYKGGDVTIAELDQKYGPRPPTVLSTSRTDGSGIFLYRVPNGTRLVGAPGPAVEIVQQHHRHVNAAPSVHPEGRVYRWIDEAGGEILELPPEAGELPELPWAWIEGLASTSTDDAADPATPAETVEFLAAHTDNLNPAGLAGIRTALGAADGSRHDTLVATACWAMREAAAGWYPAGDAVDVLGEWWHKIMANVSLRPATETEFGDAVAFAIGQVATDAERIDKLRSEATNDHLVLDGPGTVATSPPEPPARPKRADVTLAETHNTFTRWLGADYDLDALDVVLAAAAVERLDGDPVWLLMVSGSGNAKTETVQALAGADAFVTSTITSEGALLSATAKKERDKNATGGLLRKIGDRGILVIKDVTSVLSMNRDVRAGVLAALREVYDGKWERNVGTDGGRTLTWNGRIVLIGAVTTAYDSAHGVISSMGDRFALVRVDSSGDGRLGSGRQALRNVGAEEAMRAELAEVVGGLLDRIDPSAAVLSDPVAEALLLAANVVTLARSAVEKDFRGEPQWAHAAEMPTRFAKMLGQIVRGALALGIDEADALALALRVARDSVPPHRLVCLLDVLDHPGSRTSEVTKRVQRPRSTVDRILQELHLLGLTEVDDSGGKGWLYSIPAIVDRSALELLRPFTGNTTTRGYGNKGESVGVLTACDIPGDDPNSAPVPHRETFI